LSFHVSVSVHDDDYAHDVRSERESGFPHEEFSFGSKKIGFPWEGCGLWSTESGSRREESGFPS
jgi:hypothetical protein